MKKQKEDQMDTYTTPKKNHKLKLNCLTSERKIKENLSKNETYN